MFVQTKWDFRATAATLVGLRTVALAAAAWLVAATAGFGQDDSAATPGGTNRGTATGTDRPTSLTDRQMPLTLPQGSWTYVPPPPPKKVDLHDVVIVRVDEISRMRSEGEMERRKNALYDAVLKDWVFLDGLKALRPSPQSDGDPRIRGQLQQLFRAETEMQTRESLTLDIACEIADIRPNGTLVLEGHKQIRVNEEVWEVSLSGVCRREDVGPDGLVLSKNVLGLKLDKRERGHVRDGYKRGWFLRWFDEFHPF